MFPRGMERVSAIKNNKSMLEHLKAHRRNYYSVHDKRSYDHYIMDLGISALLIVVWQGRDRLHLKQAVHIDMIINH